MLSSLLGVTSPESDSEVVLGIHERGKIIHLEKKYSFIILVTFRCTLFEKFRRQS